MFKVRKTRTQRERSGVHDEHRREISTLRMPCTRNGPSQSPDTLTEARDLVAEMNAVARFWLLYFALLLTVLLWAVRGNAEMPDLSDKTFRGQQLCAPPDGSFTLKCNVYEDDTYHYLTLYDHKGNPMVVKRIEKKTERFVNIWVAPDLREALRLYELAHSF